MNEYIKREDAIDAVNTYKGQRFGEDRDMYIKRVLSELSAADVVEVVRCKNCKYKVVTEDGEYNSEDIVCCYWQSDGLTENDFCSQGKEEEQNESRTN